MQFQRITKATETSTFSDTSAGHIYYNTNGKLMIKVHSPVHQWIIHEQDNMTIYFPEKNKGYQYHNLRHQTVPFFDAFISHVKEDFGLSELGFTLAEDSSRADTLFTYWNFTGEKQKENIGKFILGYVQQRIVYAEAKTVEGNTFKKTYFKNHIQHEGRYYPKEIHLITHEPDRILREFLYYDEIKFNTSFPRDVQNFTIPQDAIIEEVNL